MTRQHDHLPDAVSPDHNDLGHRLHARSRARIFRTGYLVAGIAGAAAVIGGFALLVVMSPEGIAQDNSTVAQDGGQITAPKTKPKPRPKPKPVAEQSQPSSQSQTNSPPPPQAASAGTVPETPFMTHARQAGLTTCGTVYPALGQILTQGSEYMVQSSWNKASPNAYPLQALVGMTYRAGNYTGPAIGIVSASPNGARCEGDMVRVVPLNQDCQAAASTLPQGTRQIANLSNIPVLELPNGGGQVFMMAAGQTCVAVTVFRVAR